MRYEEAYGFVCSLIRHSSDHQVFREQHTRIVYKQRWFLSPCHRHSRKISCSMSTWNCSRRTYLKLAMLYAYGFVFANRVLAETAPESNQETTAVFRTSGGTEYIDFKVGSGEKPLWGDMLVVHYVIYTVERGMLRKFYSTYDEKQPFAFRHGNGQTIKGLEEGVDSMRVGGRRRMVIPGSLAYTVAGLGPIPPSTSVRKKLADSLKQGKI